MAILNKNEAPEGFTAVLKSDYAEYSQNFCNFCEWRKQCQDERVEKAIPNHRCMSGVVVTNGGKEVSRLDGCSVLFLKQSGLSPCLLNEDK